MPKAKINGMQKEKMLLTCTIKKMIQGESIILTTFPVGWTPATSSMSKVVPSSIAWGVEGR